ncbi:hypothetical protein [Knoellia koreensis]|uniref:Uncharacterized protein n=1 Tax=Knoellia koreensis TaxID=2730921 RepID=A0A849HE16_9MICO|nr:hypothetical protein [Knoellia sp. DB2414S]NNM44854.1 hypothetical protein [Knoellia sp. DB2414S]
MIIADPLFVAAEVEWRTESMLGHRIGQTPALPARHHRLRAAVSRAFAGQRHLHRHHSFGQA